jgi:hypothetical protein
MAKPKKPTNYGNNNAAAFRYEASKRGLDPKTWLPPGTPPPVGGPPPDWQHDELVAGQQRNVGYADAQATYDRGRIQRDYGYDATGAVDPSNPYSRAALLDRHFKETTMGNTNSFASQGQLYSGALQDAQNASTFNYLGDSNNLKNQYSDAINQTGLNQLGAYANAGSAVSSDQIRAILKALGQG